MNQKLRSARRKDLLAVIAEYEHALHEVEMCQDHACDDCKRVARSALDGDNRASFRELVAMWKGRPWVNRR